MLLTSPREESLSPNESEPQRVVPSRSNYKTSSKKPHGTSHTAIPWSIKIQAAQTVPEIQFDMITSMFVRLSVRDKLLISVLLVFFLSKWVKKLITEFRFKLLGTEWKLIPSFRQVKLHMAHVWKSFVILSSYYLKWIKFPEMVCCWLWSEGVHLYVLARNHVGIPLKYNRSNRWFKICPVRSSGVFDLLVALHENSSKSLGFSLWGAKCWTDSLTAFLK